MALVPRIRADRIQVAPDQTPFSGVRAGAGSFGGLEATATRRFGRNVEDVGGLISRRAQEMKNEDDANAAMETYTQATEELRAYLHAPDSGVYSRRGKQAQGVYEEADKKFGEIDRRHSGGLKNEPQRRAYNAMMRRHRESTMNGVARHAASERRTYKDQNTMALIKGSIEDAGNNYTDPQVIQDSLQIADSAIRANGKGKAPAVVELERQNAKSAIHSTVIDRMMVNDPLAAKAYYKKHKKEVLDDVRIEKNIKASTIRALSQAKTAEIMFKDLSETESLALARKIKDPDVRDQTVTRIKIQHNEIQAAEDKAEKDRRNRAWEAVSEKYSINDIDSKDWASLDGVAKKQITDYARAGAVARTKRTDPTVLHEAYEYIRKGKVTGALVEADLIPFRAGISDKNWGDVLKALRSREDVKDASIKRVFIESQNKSTWSQLSSSEKEDYLEFNEYIRGRVLDTKQNDEDDIRRYGTDWFMTGIRPPSGGFFGDPFGREITQAEAYKEGVEGFLFRPQDEDKRAVSAVMQALEVPARGQDAIERFYTDIYRPSVEYLINAGEPVAMANIVYVANQLYKPKANKVVEAIPES